MMTAPEPFLYRFSWTVEKTVAIITVRVGKRRVRTYRKNFARWDIPKKKQRQLAKQWAQTECRNGNAYSHIYAAALHDQCVAAEELLIDESEL
jgi:hypothetical protein